ncbi:hypothetical protein [Lichenifustis flavocetrariae]|uniref:Uncharacterized protein n=1 Tax=Lichenifustis flavocetrariae TaxID=2949735 RepID=A0AA41Z1N9_9HYPH|nr:hypothetical protein [Lichenifustis flavocetrariae]MCW6511205.1 hypothetical protein [Lichenifustis flavocetrariae]
MADTHRTLSPTPALNNDLLAGIRQIFTPNEIEVIATALAGSLKWTPSVGPPEPVR